MSPKSIINFLKKSASVVFFAVLIYGLLYLIIGIRGVIINQNPEDGYWGFKGVSVAYKVRGLDIGRDPRHQSFFYSEDRQIRVDEQTDNYIVRVKARSTFNYVSLLIKTIEIGFILGILWYFKELFKKINLQSPFNAKVVRELKILAILFILLDGLKLLQYLTFKIFLTDSFSSTTIQQDLLFSIGGNIITGLIIWMIAVIFQRGLELQEESALTV